MWRAVFLLTLSSFAFALLLGCAKSKPDVDPSIEAQRLALEKERKQFEQQKQSLTPQVPGSPVASIPDYYQRKVEPGHPVPPPSVGGGAYSSGGEPPNDLIAQDSDIEMALSFTYEKGDQGGRYIVSGQVTNTSSHIAPYVHVYVHLKGFAVEPTDALVNRVPADDAKAEKVLAGEYDNEIATLKNLAPGQSRAVSASFDEPTVDEIVGLDSGVTVKSGKSAEGTFHTSVSATP